ncbi:hypothetical protein ACFC1T_08820 [Kitasatospora sp. NPDC056076]|uniref:hypothetical protein n=1 Tax=Kitasatospora sp. NPDC056076 TaxID=3345703 RepID=UPI0035D7637B
MPKNQRHAADYAQDAAEAIREYNHLTLNSPATALPYPSSIGDSLLALESLAARLPQALHQTSHRVGVIAKDPAAFTTSDVGAAQAATEIGHALKAATAAATELARLLRLSASLANTIALRVDDELDTEQHQDEDEQP